MKKIIKKTAAAKQKYPTKANAKKKGELSRFFQIASDPNRLEILCKIMRSKQCCVSEIADELGLSIAITSHHLQTLAKSGFVQSRREGKRICYEATEIDFIKDLKRLLCKYL